MHELAITESILEIALRHARQAGAARIASIHLVLGQLSSIVDDSVQFYWDMISENTLAEDAQLVFRRIPVEMLCLGCAQRYHPTELELACPTCGGLQVKIVAGEEFFVEAIDIQLESPEGAK